MDDDFNSASALGHLFELVKEINQARAQGADQEALDVGQDTLRKLTAVFGLDLEDQGANGGDADAFIELLIEVREKLREEKLWELSDRIRDRLQNLGVVLEDTPQGTIWHWE